MIRTAFLLITLALAGLAHAFTNLGHECLGTAGQCVFHIAYNFAAEIGYFIHGAKLKIDET